ncbi:MAG: metalloprotease [Planctomycetota bacterium]
MQQTGGLWFLGYLMRMPVFMDMGAILTAVWVLVFFGGDLRFRLIALVALVVTIILHELGHALIARARGMIGIHIVLSALGGYCSYQGDRQPAKQLLISLAGPATNALIAAILFVLLSVLAATYGIQWSIMSAPSLGRFLEQAGEVGPLGSLLLELAGFGLLINIFLGVLNIMPVYPLDGGQATYAALQMTVGERRARAGTLYASVAGAAGTIALATWWTGGNPPIFITILMLFLLYQAWSTLS